MNTNVFWKQVNLLIKKNGTTQKAVAGACGLSPGTFKGWMAKDIYPTIIDGYYIARFLGVTVEYLVTGQEGTAKAHIEKARSLLMGADKELGKILK
jgi:transcriptional regulator with XRE-family HTH domain